MTVAASRERSVWAVLAGALLLLDGIVALVVSAGAAWFSTFPPVAAIEGRLPIDQSQWALALGAFVFAIACFWAAQRAVRGIRAGRMVGIVLAGSLAAFFGSVLVTASVIDLEWLAAAVVFLAPQLLIILGLLRWPAGLGTGSSLVADEGNRA